MSKKIYVSQETKPIVNKLQLYSGISLLGSMIFLVLQWLFPSELMGESGLKSAAAYLVRQCAIALTVYGFSIAAVIKLVQLLRNVGKEWRNRAETIPAVWIIIMISAAIGVCICNDTAVLTYSVSESVHNAYSVHEFRQLALVLSDLGGGETEKIEWSGFDVHKYQSISMCGGTAIISNWKEDRYFPISYGEFSALKSDYDNAQKFSRYETVVKLEYYSNSGYLKGAEVWLKNDEKEWKVPEKVMEFSVLNYVKAVDGEAVFSEDCPQIIKKAFSIRLFEIEQLDKKFIVVHINDGSERLLEEAGYIVTDKFNESGGLSVEI